jgi:hypothetical protein
MQIQTTHVVNIPWVTFSFLSVEDFVRPLLRLVQPRAVRLALEPTLGRALGASPNAFSRFGSTVGIIGDKPLGALGVGSGEAMFELIGTSCKASGLNDGKDLLVSFMNCRVCSDE